MGIKLSKKSVDLPEEIVTDILLRLPSKTLLGCKCVCKSWRRIINDSGFIQDHLHRSSLMKRPSSILIMRKNFLTDEIFCTVHCVETPREELLRLDPPFSFPVKKVDLAGSCDGWLCLVVMPVNYDQGSIIYLWNPSTMQHGTIPDSNFPNHGRHSMRVGFCASSPTSDHDYKVVKFSSAHRYWYKKMEAYSLRMNSWRNVSASIVPLNLHFGLFYENPLPVHESFYWLFVRKDFRKHIVLFDMVNEVFHQITLPGNFRGGTGIFHARLLRGTHLSLICSDLHLHFRTIDVWTMKDHLCGESHEYSWTKHVISRREVIEIMPFMKMSARCGEVVLADIRHRGLVSYDMEKDTIKEFGIHNFYSVLATYQESLVSLRLATNGLHGEVKESRRKINGESIMFSNCLRQLLGDTVFNCLRQLLLGDTV